MNRWFAEHIAFLIAFAILGIDGMRPIPCFWPSEDPRAKSRDFELWEDRRNRDEVGQ